MSIDLIMPILASVFAVVLLASVGAVVIMSAPYLQAAMQNERAKTLRDWAEVFIRSVEETKTDSQGIEKHHFVVRQLLAMVKARGWEVRDEDITAVTHAVYNTIKANL